MLVTVLEAQLPQNPSAVSLSKLVLPALFTQHYHVTNEKTEGWQGYETPKITQLGLDSSFLTNQITNKTANNILPLLDLLKIPKK